MPTPIKRAYRTFRFLFEREPWVFEVIFGAGTAAFFFLLWADWRQGPTFGSIAVLSEARPEDFWKWAGIVGGMVQCAGAFGGQPHSPGWLRWARWAMAGWLAGLWGAMSAGAWIAAPFTPTSAIYAACMIANVYVAFHVLWEDEYRRLRRLGG